MMQPLPENEAARYHLATQLERAALLEQRYANGNLDLHGQTLRYALRDLAAAVRRANQVARDA